MKTVKSLAELKSLALQKGAAVEAGTLRFNTSGDKLKPGPRKAESVVEPPPPPTPPPPAPAAVNVDLTPLAGAQERLGAMLAQALMSLPQPAAPTREWEFTINRNPDGTLSSIRARAIE